MNITTICPASCGELLQGWIGGGEKLVSYAIDCYARVTLKAGPQVRYRGSRKAYRMLEKVFEYYGYPPRDSRGLTLEIASEIPVGKGMASSTADLAATALAAASLLGKSPTEKEIAQLCIAIEPTDSTVFSDLTLLDHLHGMQIKPYGPPPRGRVLLLEGSGTINTLSFRKINREGLLKKNRRLLKKAMAAFEAGMGSGDLRELGRAATISAFANQALLYKAGLEDLHREAMENGAAGINIAHSGTVVGIIYSENTFDKQRFQARIMMKPYMGNYISMKDYNIIPGGARQQQEGEAYGLY